MGNQVNLTYRVESYTVGGQILISEMTRHTLKVPIDIDQEQQVLTKGVAKTITIYSVVGIGAPYNLNIIQEVDELVPLREPIPIQYVPISGKHVGDQVFEARLEEMSGKRAKMIYNSTDPDGIPEALSNIKLNLLPSQTWEGISEDIYAKVLELSEDSRTFLIFFTAKPPVVAKYLNTQHRTALEAVPESAQV